MTFESIAEQIKLSESPKMTISEFFKGRNVLITGSTGFMGKVLIEKILWSCEDVANLYVLIRTKKSMSSAERLEEMFKLPVFDRLRKRDPRIFSKVVPICGDVSEFNLGISNDDRKLLEDSISIVIHAASSVRFDDPLKKAVIINVRGTREMMELAKNMKHLKVFTYVSTSYCNCVQSFVEEKVIPSEYDWKMMIKLIETTDEHYINVIEPIILDKRPNTYTFTKSLAENVVSDYSKDLPCIIVRPSIVVFTISEPMPGWIDSLNGPMGISTGVGTGIIHVLYGDDQNVGDFMPCDYAINGIIVATWHKGISNTMECEVVNGAAGDKKPINPTDVMRTRETIFTKIPLSTMLWYPSVTITNNKLVYYILLLFTHILPGLLIDIVLKAKGIKFRLMRIYRKAFVANIALRYFMTNEWKISTKKYDNMFKSIPIDDQKNFEYDTGVLDEDEVFLIATKGVKQYIFNEDMSEAAIKSECTKYKIRFWVHHITTNLFYFLIFYAVAKFSMVYLNSELETF